MSEKDSRRQSNKKIESIIATPILGLGLGVGLLATQWSSWKFGDQPDLYDGNHILFLRSNIETLRDPKSYHDRTGEMAINVDRDIFILIPVFTAQYHIGSYYKGTKIESEVGARRAIRDYIREGRHMWAVIRDLSKPSQYQNIVDNLYDHYVESPLFKLTVSTKNPFKDELPEPIQPGIYDTVVGGYFILMKLPQGSYLIWFGANGPGINHSEAYYQLNVKFVDKISPVDISYNIQNDMKSKLDLDR